MLLGRLLSSCLGQMLFFPLRFKKGPKGGGGGGGADQRQLERAAADDDEFVPVEGRKRAQKEQQRQKGGCCPPPPVIRVEAGELRGPPNGAGPARAERGSGGGADNGRGQGGRQQQSMEAEGQKEADPPSPIAAPVAVASPLLPVHLLSSSSATMMITSRNGGGGGRPTCSSSLYGEADLGKPCARLRLSVQFSQQKRLLIVTLHELAQLDELQLDDAISVGSNHRDRGREERTTAVQVRLALLSSDPAAKVQKFQSKFQPLDQVQIQLGQTFAFELAQEQLADSVVRLRLYRKGRRQRRPLCLGAAFLRNYLVDPETRAKSLQNHFLQFRRTLEPTAGGNGTKGGGGTMSLFPSLLSLHSANGGSPRHSSPSKSSCAALGSPSGANANANGSARPDCLLPLRPPSFPASVCPSPCSGLHPLPPQPAHHHQHQQQLPSPQSASSRRGSTVDESGRFCSLPQADGNTPEVLLSLCYFEDQNRLVVGVNKVAALKLKDEQQQGVFVRICALSPTGTERAKHKSDCVRANGNGETHFNSQAFFHVPRHELAQSTVQVQLYSVQGGILRRKSRIGTLSLGEDNCSSADAQTHWREMIQGMGTTVDKWHLLEPA